jgi:hypothetical protein
MMTPLIYPVLPCERKAKEPGDVHQVEGNAGDDPVMTTR